jgi:hypothetical protein
MTEVWGQSYWYSRFGLLKSLNKSFSTLLVRRKATSIAFNRINRRRNFMMRRKKIKPSSMWWLLLRPFFINCILANIRTKLDLRAESGCIETHRICRFDGNRHFQLRFRLRNSRKCVLESNALLALANCCIAAQSNHHNLLYRDGEWLEEKKNARNSKN